jgi:hypothetical protein
MRNIKHHCIILTAHNVTVITKIRTKILELIKLNMEASNASKLVGEPVESLINNYFTLVVYPDGSKEGHETSEDGDILRKKIISYLDEHNRTQSDSSVSYMEFFYGADDGTAKILKNG